MFSKLLLSCGAILAFSFSLSAQSSMTLKDANGRTIQPLDLAAQRQIEQEKYPHLQNKETCVKLEPAQALAKIAKNIEECERHLANVSDAKMKQKYQESLILLRAQEEELAELAAKK